MRIIPGFIYNNKGEYISVDGLTTIVSEDNRLGFLNTGIDVESSFIDSVATANNFSDESQ